LGKGEREGSGFRVQGSGFRETVFTDEGRLKASSTCEIKGSENAIAGSLPNTDFLIDHEMKKVPPSINPLTP